MEDSSEISTCPGEPSTAVLGLGIFLLIGTIVSFVPQHIKLIMKKSHVGLSISKVVLACMTASTGMTYYAMLEYHNTFFCCTTSSLVCFANVNNFLQLVMIVLCDQLILFLFVYYFDHKWLRENGQDHLQHWVEAKRLIAAVVVYQAFLALLFTITITVTGWGSQTSQIIGSILLLVSSLGTVLQWAPQIYRTYKLKHVGALSIPMIILQAIGAVLTAVFFYADAPDSLTWLPFVIATVLITTLCIMAVYYWIQDKRREKNERLSEREPLVQGA